MDEQESSFLKWNLFLVKIVKMTKRDLECDINLVNKAAAGLERIDSYLEASTTTWIKCYQTESCATEKSFMKERVS